MSEKCDSVLVDRKHLIAKLSTAIVDTGFMAQIVSASREFYERKRFTLQPTLEAWRSALRTGDRECRLCDARQSHRG
jgi:hypothetical protein